MYNWGGKYMTYEEIVDKIKLHGTITINSTKESRKCKATILQS